jgi:hypothetical protein
VKNSQSPKKVTILKVARISNFFHCSGSLLLKYAPCQVLAVKPNNCGAGMIKLLFNIIHHSQKYSDFESCSNLNFFSLLRFLGTKICSPSSLSCQTQWLWRRDDQAYFQKFSPTSNILIPLIQLIKLMMQPTTANLYTCPYFCNFLFYGIKTMKLALLRRIFRTYLSSWKDLELIENHHFLALYATYLIDVVVNRSLYWNLSLFRRFLFFAIQIMKLALFRKISRSYLLCWGDLELIENHHF